MPFPTHHFGAIQPLVLGRLNLPFQPFNIRRCGILPSSLKTTLSVFKSRTNMPMVCKCLGGCHFFVCGWLGRRKATFKTKSLEWCWHSIESWLIFLGSLILAYYKSHYNWVGFHPLYTAKAPLSPTGYCSREFGTDQLIFPQSWLPSVAQNSYSIYRLQKDVILHVTLLAALGFWKKTIENSNNKKDSLIEIYFKNHNLHQEKKRTEKKQVQPSHPTSQAETDGKNTASTVHSAWFSGDFGAEIRLWWTVTGISTFQLVYIGIVGRFLLINHLLKDFFLEVPKNWEAPISFAMISARLLLGFRWF